MQWRHQRCLISIWYCYGYACCNVVVGLWINSLDPGRQGCYLSIVISKLISKIDIFSILNATRHLMISQHWLKWRLGAVGQQAIFTRTNHDYRQVSNIRRTKSQNLNFLVSSCSCLCAIYWSQVLSQEWRCSWSALTGDAPTTSERSTILLLTKVPLILEIWLYIINENISERNCSEYV